MATPFVRAPSRVSGRAAPQRSRLRVVIANTSRAWGGTEHYAVQVAAGLARRGHAVHFLAGHPPILARVREVAAELATTPARDGHPPRLSVEHCPLRRDGDIAGLWRMVQAYRRFRATAALQTKWREYFLGGLAARLARVPLNVVSLGLRIAPARDIKRRVVFGLADRIVVNAEEIAVGLAARPWIDASKLRVVHNGVDLRRFRPIARNPAARDDDARTIAPADPETQRVAAAALAFRAELGVPPDAPLVGTIGALTGQKEHETFVRAMADVVARHPSAHGVVVGEGDLRRALAAAVADLGLQGRVHLPGFRADVRPVLAALDLFALSSSNEGMAWVLLEALACGLPIVTTDVSGARACVVEGENGRIVPPRDRAALAAALAALLGDADRRRRMGARSRALAEERFDAERMIAETEALLGGA